MPRPAARIVTMRITAEAPSRVDGRQKHHESVRQENRQSAMMMTDAFEDDLSELGFDKDMEYQG